jgi:catechol 2,3-dioxygenase-like lactoylglutathione lyase family enzyme
VKPWLWLVAALVAGPAPGPRGDEFRVESVVAPSITVADLDRSVRFYCDVLSFQKVGEVAGDGAAQPARTVRLALGEERLDLKAPLTPGGRAMPPGSRANDRWFQHVAIVVADMGRAFARLRDRGVKAISQGPQRLPVWNRAAADISAFYFKDPDDHALELIQFPPDKGAAKWHRATGQLFLGIDHTAIVVADSEASIRFYRRLGLRVAGHSENWGIEQERLSGVPGARVRITSLRAQAGPGIELLEYLAPRDGRPRPKDTRWNDLWSWRTQLAVTSPAARRFEIADPDGHTLVVGAP